MDTMSHTMCKPVVAAASGLRWSETGLRVGWEGMSILEVTSAF